MGTLRADKTDLVILEVLVLKLNGLEILKRLRKHSPSTRTLVFSTYQNLIMVKVAMRAGAHGYVEKSARLEDLKQGIRAVSEDRINFGPEVAVLLRDFVREHGPDLLTSREREVLKLIAESHSTKQIAAKLSVSFKTADNHRANLMRKLGMHEVASLTRFAIEIGLIESGGSFLMLNGATVPCASGAKTAGHPVRDVIPAQEADDPGRTPSTGPVQMLA